jgi:glycosyltransferase involved in cell wall biosynthesis
VKILHIDTGREMRGGQIQVMLTLQGLQEAGHDCVLLARKHTRLWLAAREGGIPTRAANPFMLAIHSLGVDLVHAHDARAHTMAALACSTRFVVSRRVGFPVKRSPASRWKYRRARRFIAVSRFVAGELRRAGIPDEQIDVVYDGIELAQPAADWRPCHSAVALKSADPQKGRTLIEAAAQITGIPVVFSSDLRRDLLNASMFVYITHSEGLGSATLLAMAMGIPVIASSVGGLAEVFEDGVSGIYVRNDVDEIAGAMRSVRENHALATTLIQGGRQRVNDNFSKQSLIQGTLRSYESALA